MPIQIKTQIPGPKSQALFAERKEHVSRSVSHVTPVFIERALGAMLEDVDGNRFIDFSGGIGVSNVGHSSERVIAAIREQADRHLHLAFGLTPYESYVRVCQKLNALAPGTFAKKSFLANSGAEAVENAVKFARFHTKRPAVVCFDHAFHGRTYLALSLTSKAVPYKAGMGPFNSEIYRAPFPDRYRWPNSSDVTRECFAEFVNLVHSQIGENQVAAVIFEPVLGEGGFIPMPREFLAKLREFCTAHGSVLIADEIQTGFGRTGTFFACEQLGIVPDLTVTAKSLGGGLPLSAVVGRADIMDAPPESGVGGTFGGNPLACATALAVFETFEKDGLLSRSRALGEQLQSVLRGWKDKYPVIGDARGIGPMQALEFVKDRATKEPYPEFAKKLVRHCNERGLILLTAGTHGNIVRLLMPLTIDQETLKEGLGVLESGLRELSL